LNPETGVVNVGTLLSRPSMNFGNLIQPMLAEGQVHGVVAAGYSGPSHLRNMVVYE